MSPFRTVLATVRVLLPRPGLWPTAIRQAARFAPDQWWRRAPFLPVPDRALLEFRGTTQYGDPDRAPEPADVVAWLEWCRAEQRRA
jgi:hypothetical protein